MPAETGVRAIHGRDAALVVYRIVVGVVDAGVAVVVVVAVPVIVAIVGCVIVRSVSTLGNPTATFLIEFVSIIMICGKVLNFRVSFSLGTDWLRWLCGGSACCPFLYLFNLKTVVHLQTRHILGLLALACLLTADVPSAVAV